MGWTLIPLIGLWFAFLALPISGVKNAVWIGAGCALLVLIVRLVRAGIQSHLAAEPIARVQRTVAEREEELDGMVGLREKLSNDDWYALGRGVREYGETLFVKSEYRLPRPQPLFLVTHRFLPALAVICSLALVRRRRRARARHRDRGGAARRAAALRRGAPARPPARAGSGAVSSKSRG